jgi:hypothetical protein
MDKRIKKQRQKLKDRHKTSVKRIEDDIREASRANSLKL